MLTKIYFGTFAIVNLFIIIFCIQINKFQYEKIVSMSPYLQEALLERLGKNAVAFSIDVNTLAPPSVQLLPAKRYSGAPIGTSYDIRIFTGELAY